MIAVVLLLGTAVVAMFGDLFPWRRASQALVFFGLAVAVLACLRSGLPFPGDMVVMDGYARAFSALTVVLTAVVFWVIYTLPDRGWVHSHIALILFSAIGALLMVSATHLVTLFLGIELLSIPLYVLAVSRKTDRLSQEAGLKYFVMGAFTSGILLFGMALLYAATGQLYLSAIISVVMQYGVSASFLAGAGMVLAGLFFKVGLVPFHFWIPDVYEGTPTPHVTWMSAVAKVAAMATLFRVVAGYFGGLFPFWHAVVWVVVVLTLIVSNVVALAQGSIKRMLAYSSIAQAGFMAMLLLAPGSPYPAVIFYYGLAYTLSLASVFFVLVTIEDVMDAENPFHRLTGLASRNRLLAVLLAVGLFSLAGVPPLTGFFAKYLVLATVLLAGRIGVVLLAVAMSVVGLVYYLRWIPLLWTPGDYPSISLNGLQKATAIFLIVLLVAAGLFPGTCLNLMGLFFR
jgi:NADH-quinone oxidoreductase subunit N